MKRQTRGLAWWGAQADVPIAIRITTERPWVGRMSSLPPNASPTLCPGCCGIKWGKFSSRRCIVFRHKVTVMCGESGRAHRFYGRAAGDAFAFGDGTINYRSIATTECLRRIPPGAKLRTGVGPSTRELDQR